jgi:hypothetical protein
VAFAKDATIVVDLFGDFGLFPTVVKPHLPVAGENIVVSSLGSVDARCVSRLHSYDEIKFQ